MQQGSKVFKASLPVLADIRDFVLESAKSAGLPDHNASGIVLAVDEACSNVILHGYKGEDGDIEICVEAGPQRFKVEISDHAVPFDPLNSNAESALNQRLEERAPGGLGLLMIEQNTSTIHYDPREGGGNVLTLVVGGSPEVCDEH